VDRPEIVLRRSDDQLSVLANDIWISPLRDELKAALTEEIHRDLSQDDRSRSRTSDERVKIHVEVERFESASEYALIQIAWHVTIPGTSRELMASCETSSRVPVGAGMDALVRGHQRAIAEIAARIASGILDLETVGEGGCGST